MDKKHKLNILKLICYMVDGELITPSNPNWEERYSLFGELLNDNIIFDEVLECEAAITLFKLNSIVSPLEGLYDDLIKEFKDEN